MKMKIMSPYSLLFILSLAPALAQAQDHHTGGGDASAADLQYYFNTLDQYLTTDEGKALFPEIKQPDFHQLVASVRPVVKDERVKDDFGIAQTCISHVEEGNRYVQCDSTRLPKITLDNQPSFYRLSFHELLFQAGLEMPTSANIPSNFEISSRLKMHLTEVKMWLPGDAEDEEYDFLKEDPQGVFDCYDSTNQFGHFSATLRDENYSGRSTVTVDNQSMPVHQKFEIKKVSHAQFDSDYVIQFDVKSESNCIGFGKGMRTTRPTTCNPVFFATNGTLEIRIQSMMTRKGPIARREEDVGKTLGSYAYSHGSSNWKSHGFLSCSFDATKLRTLVK